MENVEKLIEKVEKGKQDIEELRQIRDRINVAIGETQFNWPHACPPCNRRHAYDPWTYTTPIYSNSTNTIEIPTGTSH